MDRGEKPKENLPAKKESKASQLAKENSSLSAGFLIDAAKKAGVSVPADKLSIIQNFMDRAKFGHQSALPMICKGRDCPILEMCPLYEAGLPLPIKKICPVESAVIAQWVNRTMTSLNIDPNEPEFAVDMDMVYELAGYELLRMRLASSLSTDPEVSKEVIVGYSPQGDPIYDIKPNMSLLMLEKYSKVVGKLRDALVATRKSQAQVGKLAGDGSIRAANIMAKARELAEKRLKPNISDADFEVLDEKPKES